MKYDKLSAGSKDYKFESKKNLGVVELTRLL